MPVLTNQRYELFAQALARGETADEAYQTAGYEPNRGNASTLKAKQIITDRVAEIQAYKLERTVVDREWVIAKLVDNVERAMQAQEIMAGDSGTGEYRYEGSVANRALELLGKEIGMFVDKKEVVGAISVAHHGEVSVSDSASFLAGALGGGAERAFSKSRPN